LFLCAYNIHNFIQKYFSISIEPVQASWVSSNVEKNIAACRFLSLRMLHHHHHHLSQETSTAGHRPPPKFSDDRSCAALIRDFPRPSPDRRSTLWGPTNAASPGTRSPFEDLSAPTAVSHPPDVACPLPLEVCNSYA
jgi:hypothetical protein